MSPDPLRIAFGVCNHRASSVGWGKRRERKLQRVTYNATCLAGNGYEGSSITMLIEDDWGFCVAF
jgi:hypothetical protein